MVNNAVPVVRQITGQFIADMRHIQVEGTGHDHGASVTRHPQLMNNRRHQTQDASGALEGRERGPIFIQAVKHFRMNRIARNQAVAVGYFLAFRREVGGIRPVHLTERVADGVAGFLILAVKEQSAADDFEAFIRGDRLPDGFHAPEGVFNGLKSLLPGFPADLNGGFRDGSDDEAVFTGAGGFGDLLDEGDEVVKGAGGKSVHAVDILRVSNQLVHQDQAGAAFVEEVLQVLRSRRDAFLIRFADVFSVQLRFLGGCHQLISHLTPECADAVSGKVFVLFPLGRVQRGADQNGDIGVRELRQAGAFHHGFQGWNGLELHSAVRDMVKRQHAVRFTAAERCFQLNDRFAAFAADALQELKQKSRHAVGYVGPGEELYRVTVFNSALAPGNLRKVRGEFRGRVTPFRDIRMRDHDVAPSGKAPALHHSADLVRFYLGFGRLLRIRGCGSCFRPVSELPIKSADLFLTLRVNLRAEQRHCVQRTFRVRLCKIGIADMGNLITHAHQLGSPGFAVH